MAKQHIEKYGVTEPKVVITILNWNDKYTTKECLESIRKLEYPNKEVIVIDNASTDGSQEYIKKFFSEVILLQNTDNLGFTGGFNVGILEALKRKANYILCLNNDTILDSTFIGQLVAVGEYRNGVGGLCPKEYNYHEPNRLIYAGGKVGVIRSKIKGYGELDVGQYDEEHETQMLCGAAMMFKSEALLSIGLFDNEYFFNSEDKDIAVRLMKGGYKLIYVPKAQLWHKRHGSTGGGITPLMVYFSARNSLLFVRKHGKPCQILIFLVYFFFFHIPFLLIRCSRKKESIRSIIYALKWHINPRNVPKEPRLVEYMLKNC
ncbi:glycosyltransferase family 2 protein [Chloroflexota bacterium]